MVDFPLATQPDEVRLLPDDERDRVPISAIQVDGRWVVISKYGDESWMLSSGPTNVNLTHKVLNFGHVPVAFRAVAKEVMYRYLRCGREGAVKPRSPTIFRTFTELLPFLRYLETLRIKRLDMVTPMVCANYVAACRALRQTRKKGSPPLSAALLDKRFLTVELLFEMSQFSSDPIPIHPWPEDSARHLSGRTGLRLLSKTPVIPDNVFTALFQSAWTVVQGGNALLDLRDGLDKASEKLQGESPYVMNGARNRYLRRNDWKGGGRTFTVALNELRTACYIVVASLSGCRNHELAYLQTGACYQTEDDEGEVYWWMRGRSDKTGTGKTEWMIPEAAVEALRVMDRWAAPLQLILAAEIAQRRAANPLDPQIAEAQKHVGAVFLGAKSKRNILVRTLTNGSWCRALGAFAKRIALDWEPTTHQFRRTFANYAARSRFGDLRYLREHFKHWSQDMTNDAYALNGSQEMELYAEIQDELEAIKLGLAEQWLNPKEPLAGGYGRNLVAWRSRDESVALFRDHATMVRSVADSHAIRSIGHAWCTADDNRCLGSSFEKTRCSGCDNAVISRFHARLYQSLYADLQDLAACDDIGPGGQARVQRDLVRCRDVLISLGYDPEAKAT